MALSRTEHGRAPAPDLGGRSARGARVALLVALALVVGARAWGQLLHATGTELHLAGGYPLRGALDPRLAPGLAVTLLAAVALVRVGPAAARRLPWPALPGAAAAAAAAWAVALAGADGPAALAAPLESRFEYLADVPRVQDAWAALDDFVGHVPEGAPGFTWTTHVAGHPPGALLAFVGLDRVGLGGSGWAAAVCVAAGASAVAAVLLTVRTLAGEPAARAAAPFVVVAPTALWVATSADALWCAAVAWGVAALAAAAARRGAGSAALAVAGGSLLGLALLGSYGMLLAAPIAAAAVLARAGRRHGVRVLAVGAAATAALLAAVAVVGGFAWPEGLVATAERVRAGPAAVDRPAAYALLAGGPAAAALAAGPAAVAGLGRLAAGRDPGVLGRAVVLPLAALAAMAVALASTLAEGEVERIFLPFLVWLLPVAALHPAAEHRRWLAATAAAAVVIQVAWRLTW